MSKVPTITIKNTAAYTGELNRTGSMCNAYAPLKNLEDKDQTLCDFTTDKLNFDLLHPVDIILQDSYDGAVNMILNDGKNIPRLINSRFSVVDNKEFKIPSHTGHKNTNIYEEETFDIDTSLKAIAKKIPHIEYKGMTQFAGSLPCGAYTFYFKLADADGNESEVLAESGLVQVYVGGNSYPDVNVRMGLENENSGKAVNFVLSNIDTGFDYVHVLYARSSSGNEQAAVDTYHKIIFDYPISEETCNITITGGEQIINISAEELYTDYADIESVKTQAVVNNVLFFGNIKKQEHDWDALRIASWKIGYSCGTKSNVGTISKNYEISTNESENERGVYYNTYNTYYKVGYWPDEIYRFGIVYIFNDNSLSPVFNIQGVDFNKLKENNFSGNNLFCKDSVSDSYSQWELSPEDYYFDKSIRSNSKGVIKFPNNIKTFKMTKGGFVTPTPLYIKFDLSYINTKILDSLENINPEPIEDFFKTHGIKGYFFVRQKRVPTILAQGIAIGLTNKDNGAIPVIKKDNGYCTLSFLQEDQLIQLTGKDILVKHNNVKINALLVPDAELSEATFNDIFVSNKYTLIKTSQCYFDYKDNLSYVKQIIDISDFKKYKRKLTNVQEDIKTLTDGEVYFSTLAGNASEPYKTSDVNNVWNETEPLNLTTSTSVIRGQWGPFVGVGEDENEESLNYGGIYNIKKENYYDDEASATDLDFQLRMEREDAYRAICDRTEWENIEIICYRGDCFQSLYTHRMFRNFIDPELPTNDKIINPACWAQNYAVRCTAIEQTEDTSNVLSENQGWYIDKKQSKYANEIAQSFEVKERNSSDWSWDPEKQYWYKGDDSTNPDQVANLIGGVDPVSNYIGTDELISLVKPSEQEQSGVGGILKNIFKSSKWALRGLASINRADVNAVGLGQWITFPICSAKNIALRDIDYSNASELAIFNRKRSFYPLQKIDIHNPLRDSNVINQAASISVPHKRYYIIPDTPFIKQEYFTRVVNSLRDSADSVTNEFKVMLEEAYRDYTKIHGPITKLVPLGSKILVVFHHGLGVLAINDLMSQAKSALEYLPMELNMTLSPDYGSMWKDSVIITPKGIYGIDTVAKVIWKVVLSDPPQLQLISNFKVEKFLIDNIDLSEFTMSPFIGRINVKSHYNAFKQDVIFTYYNDILYKFNNPHLEENKGLSDYDITSDGYLLNKDTKDLYQWEDSDHTLHTVQGEKVKAYYDEDSGILMTYSKLIEKEKDSYDSTFKWATGKSWSLCFNEILERFVTFYDWIPIESENIDNIWFSFDREATNKLVDLGCKGEIKRTIKPTEEDQVGGRDENYGLNVIDPTFNSTVSITYFSDDTSANIRFEPITYSYKSGEKLVIGCYVLGPASYRFTCFYGRTYYFKKDFVFNGSSTLNVVDSDWLFVVLEISDPGINNFYINVSLIGATVSNDFAISDFITDIYENKDGKFIRGLIPDEKELPEYYTVRTLTDSLPLWKHGFAGLYDNADELKPTFWYGQQHEFNFEFVARKDAVHKVFNNLLIISNKTEPNKFEFEVVGEAYDWYKYKPVLKWIADQISVATDNPNYLSELDDKFRYVLSNNYKQIRTDYPSFPKIFGMKDTDVFLKLPYIKVTDACVPTMDPEIIGEKKGTKDEPSIYLTPEQQGKGNAHSDNTVDCCLVYDKQLNEFRVHTEQLGNNILKYGRLRGNMQYLEDLWRIEIRPVSFKWVYLDPLDGMNFTRIQETRHRDKYIKIKVRYTGEDLAIIQAISTLFDYSYA